MNYYEILKIPRTASKQQIKSSYKKLVKQYHPDLYVGDKNFAEQKIKEINEAYAILSHPEKKLAYDEYLNLTVESTPVYSSTVTTPSPNAYYTPSQTSSQSFFSKFVIENFNQLDKKRQLQIFVLILLLILALFLMNFWEVKYYLNNTLNDSSPSSSTARSHSSQNNNTIDFSHHEEMYEFENPEHATQDDWKTFDDWLYDYFFKPYETTIENEFENENYTEKDAFF